MRSWGKWETQHGRLTYLSSHGSEGRAKTKQGQWGGLVLLVSFHLIRRWGSETNTVRHSTGGKRPSQLITPTSNQLLAVSGGVPLGCIPCTRWTDSEENGVGIPYYSARRSHRVFTPGMKDALQIEQEHICYVSTWKTEWSRITAGFQASLGYVARPNLKTNMKTSWIKNASRSRGWSDTDT